MIQPVNFDIATQLIWWQIKINYAYNNWIRRECGSQTFLTVQFMICKDVN